MARIRSIKPSFFRSDDVVAIPWGPRLTWLGLWVYGDDHGRSIDDPRLIKGDVWLLEDEVTVEHVRAHLDALADLGRIRRYAVDGKRYLEVVNFNKHQVIKTPSKTGHPAPPWADSPITDPVLGQPFPSTGPTPKTEVEGEVEGGSGYGGGAPTPYCDRHPRGTDAPCIACKNARLAYEQLAKVNRSPSLRLPPRTHDRTGYCAKPGHEEYPTPCHKCAIESAERGAA